MTSPQIRALARRLDSLEKQARQRKLPTLGFSSIDDGAITSVDVDGNLQMIIGKQFDGTQTSAVVTGPKPPRPIVPYLIPQAGAMRIFWDGTFEDGAVAPMDFARVLVYAVPLADLGTPHALDHGHIVGQFNSATGGEVSAVLGPGVEYAVFFATWTEAGKYSDPSDVAVETTGVPLQGEPGEQGAPGPPGEDGQSLYTWIKYADDALGNGMSDTPTGKTYIGLAYNKPVALEGTDPEEYTWSLIKGADGQDGQDGADGADGNPGPPGEDGQSLYTWVKYATSSTGAGMSDDPTGKDFIGLAYNKTSPTESEVPSDYTWSRYRGDEDPTAPPAGSPSISVVGTTSSLIVEASPVQAGTRIRYYISTEEGFTPSPATLFTTSTSRVVVINSLVGGTPLSPSGTYYLRTVAENDMGSAAASEEATGTLDLNNVGTVVAEQIITGFVLTGQIQVGQILIDADDGISINQPGGGYILRFPSNGVDPLELTAQIVAQSLNVEDNLSIGGNGQLFGDLQMTNGITTPEVQPTLGTYHPSTLMTAIGNGSDDVNQIYHGMVEVPGSDNLVATAISFFGAGIRLYNKYSGSLGAYPDPTNGKAWTQNFHPWGGITELNGYYYVFGTDSNRVKPGTYDTMCYLYKIDATTFNKVGELELWNTSTWAGGDYKPRIGTDGTGIYIFWINADNSLRFRRTTPSLSSWGSITHLMDVPTRRGLADVHSGTHDGIGYRRWWIGTDGGSDPIWAFSADVNGPAARQPQHDFHKAVNRTIGFTYDSVRQQMISIDRFSNLHRYGRNPSDRTLYGKYAWLDDNPTGGTHETIPGPTRIQSIPARSYISTTVGTPPDLNNDDALNTDKANKVAAYFSYDGSTWRRHVYQPTRTRTGAWGTGSTYVFGSGWTEQDIGKIVTGPGIQENTRVKFFHHSGGVSLDKVPSGSNAGTTLTVAAGWSAAFSGIDELPTGTPKVTNEFLQSDVQTPGRIRSTAAGALVDGIAEEIMLKGDGQFRLGNYTHVRHAGARQMTGTQNLQSGSKAVINFGSTKEVAQGVTWDGTNSRWIINKRGVYSVALSVQWPSNGGGGGRRVIYIRKNGSDYVINEDHAGQMAGPNPTQLVTTSIPCEPGDTIDACAWQNSGGVVAMNDGPDVGLRHYFSITFVCT